MTKTLCAILGSIALVISSVSCVSGKKYASLEDTSKQFMNERDEFKSDNIGLEMKNRELEAKLASLEKEIGTVKQDISKAEGERDKALEDYNKLSRQIQ